MDKNDLRLERERRRKEYNHMAILSAAEKIFGEKGYAYASMDEIARQAQFSKATIYRYFQSKDQIFMEILYKVFSESLQEMIVIREKPWTSEKKLQELMQQAMSFFGRKKNLIRIYFLERIPPKQMLELYTGKASESFFDQLGIPLTFRSIMEEINKIFSLIIQEGVESGEFRGIEPREAVAFLGAIIRGIHFRDPFQDSDNNLSHSSDVLIDFFMNGIKSTENKQKGAS